MPAHFLHMNAFIARLYSLAPFAANQLSMSSEELLRPTLMPRSSVSEYVIRLSTESFGMALVDEHKGMGVQCSILSD